MLLELNLTSTVRFIHVISWSFEIGAAVVQLFPQRILLWCASHAATAVRARRIACGVSEGDQTGPLSVCENLEWKYQVEKVWKSRMGGVCNNGLKIVKILFIPQTNYRYFFAELCFLNRISTSNLHCIVTRVPAYVPKIRWWLWANKLCFINIIHGIGQVGQAFNCC